MISRLPEFEHHETVVFEYNNYNDDDDPRNTNHLQSVMETQNNLNQNMEDEVEEDELIQKDDR